VDDAADLRVSLIQDQVSRGVGRGPEVSLHHSPVFQGYDYELFGSKGVVWDAAGLDHKDPGVAVDAAGVPEGQGHKPGPDETQVGTPNLLTKVGKRNRHGGSSDQRRPWDRP
jgi:hypothetical protein